MENAELRRATGNIFAEICAALLTAYIHWSYIVVVNNRLLLMLIFAFAMFNFLLKDDRLVRWDPYQTVFLVLILYCCIGTAYSQNMAAGERFLLQLILAFGIHLITRDDSPFLKIALRWISISGVLTVVAILLQVAFPEQMLKICATLVKPEAYAMTAELYSYGYYSGLSGFNCIAGFHAAALMGICFVIGLKTTSVSKRIVNYVIAALSLFALVATQKRGVLIASIIAAFVTSVHYFWSRRNMKKLMQMVIIFCVIALLLYAVMTNTESGQKMLERFTESDDISSGRFGHYQYIFSSSEDSLLFGHGTGSLMVGLNNDAHNIYLQILYDHGILGLMVYLVFFVMPLVFCMKKVRQGDASEFLLISMFLQVLFLFYGLTGNPLYDYCLFMFYLLSVSMMNVRKEEIRHT